MKRSIKLSRLTNGQLKYLLRHGEVRFGNENAAREFKNKVGNFDKTLYNLEFQARALLAYSHDLEFSMPIFRALKKVWDSIKEANVALNSVASEINNM